MRAYTIPLTDEETWAKMAPKSPPTKQELERLQRAVFSIHAERFFKSGLTNANLAELNERNSPSQDNPLGILGRGLGDAQVNLEPPLE